MRARSLTLPGIVAVALAISCLSSCPSTWQPFPRQRQREPFVVLLFLDITASYRSYLPTARSIALEMIGRELKAGDTLAVRTISAESYGDHNRIYGPDSVPSTIAFSEKSRRWRNVVENAMKKAGTDPKQARTDVRGALMYAADFFRSCAAGRMKGKYYAVFLTDLEDNAKRHMISGRDLAGVRVRVPYVPRKPNEDMSAFSNRVEQWTRLFMDLRASNVRVSGAAEFVPRRPILD